ncbi:cytochrome P450 [Trametes versicolor FP-101664 SS1]|uniref:cytochrome P450 n=1 Tax=Trametes versicolor (strain FP-101664) TaxID=717944 RepID=UPI0004623F49|nr:cytochrome P450 [Trametes versicolor FP-101664 SS1]EIW54984.1 cytochrome P450 [Trametes versicolor FP-101664 SS1]
MFADGSREMFATLLQSVLICTVTYSLWRYFRQAFVKSPLDNIPGPPSPSWMTGNLPQMFNRQGMPFYHDLIDKYGPVVRLHGAYGRKILYVFDPRAMHSIVVKDQYSYEQPDWFIKSNLLTLGPGLLSTLGEHHRKQRRMLNPIFSIAHMRHMMPIFYDVGHKLRVAVEERVRAAPAEIDMLNWMGRTALELIGQAGLGYSFDPLEEDLTPDVYADAIKAYVPSLYDLSVFRWTLPYLVHIGTPAFRRRVMQWLPMPRLHRLQAVVDTMHRRATEIYREKKARLDKGDEALLQQVGEGKDLMSILLKANTQASVEDRLSEEELIGQMVTMTFAAMDTTSNALSQILHLLAQNPHAQARARAEVLEASPDGRDIPYDELVALPFLDAVCRETLRLYPPATFIFREAQRDMILPLAEPLRGVDGALMSEIAVPKDTVVHVGIMGSNMNRKTWGADAWEWKPERWLAPQPDALVEAHIPGVYSNLMTFIGGGRACIGFKFSQLEMKVVLALLLANFSFELSDKPIAWNISGIRFPTVGVNGKKPELPLKVSLLSDVSK